MALKADTSLQIRYAYFDIHANCRSQDYSKLNKFLEKDLAVALKGIKYSAIRIDRL